MPKIHMPKTEIHSLSLEVRVTSIVKRKKAHVEIQETTECERKGKGAGIGE